jgi:hypothetical protein
LAFLKASGFDTALTTGEDKALVLEMLLRGFAVYAIPEAGAIHRLHACGSLTSALNMANGIEAFYRKYAKLMNLSQKMENRSKIHHYKGLVTRSYRHAAIARAVRLAQRVVALFSYR